MNQSDPNISSHGKVALIRAAWHADIVEQCCNSFIDELTRLSDGSLTVETFEVPGAFEIPLQARSLLRSQRYLAAVGAGQTVENVDAGVKPAPQDGSIAGRYFCDENRNDLDDNEAGVVVQLCSYSKSLFPGARAGADSSSWGSSCGLTFLAGFLFFLEDEPSKLDSEQLVTRPNEIARIPSILMDKESFKIDLAT